MTDERSNHPSQDHDLERPEVLDIDVTRRSIVSLLLAAVGWSAGIGRGLAASSRTLVIPSLNEEFRTPGVLQRPHLRVIRPDDFIYLDVEYENIATAGDPAKALVRVEPAKPALLIVNHQPQAVADQAYQQVTKSEADTMGGTSAQPLGVESAPTPPQVAGARMARPSRVAFVMPHGISSIPFTLAQLLKAFRTWEMNLDYQAAPDTRRFARVAIPLVAEGLKKHFDQAAVRLKSGAGPASQSALEKALQRAYAVAIAQAATNGGTPPAGGAVDAIIRQEIGRNLTGSASQITQRLGTPRSITINRKAVVNFHLLPSKPHPPADTVTAIELPYRLIQSPLATAGWYHSDGLETHANRTELWHTRLGARRTGRIDDMAPEPLRAIWSPDYVNPEPHGTPFTMSLDGLDRQMLVKLTAGYNEVVPSIAGRHQYAPTPAMARRVMLTALGGWLLEDGNWPGGRPAGVDLTEWNHYAAMARDYYVRVVYAGYLFPLGHAASLVKVTERKFEDQPGGGRVALLRQRFFIIVRQKTRFYPGANQRYDGRDFPFSRVDILTVTTPDLAEPGSDPNDRIPDSMNFYSVTKPRREAFWPVTKGAFPGALKDFMFQAVGYDQAGSAIPFTTPLFFVSANIDDAADLATIITAYKNVKDQARRKRPFNGAVIQFAPNVGTDPGDTNTPTVSITFAGALPTAPVPPNPSEGEPAQFYPATESAELKLPAVQRLLGNDQPVTAQVASVFLQSGLDEAANKGQVFLSLIGANGTLPPGVPSDKGGGLVAPNIYPTAFSRTFGTVAGANNAQKFISGTFDPKDFLANSLTLFGVVPLGEIIAAAADFKKAPQLVNQEFPDRVTSTFDLHQQNLQSYSLPGTSNPIFVPDADGVASALDINAITTVERNGAKPAGPPTTTVTAKINSFKVNLFGCFILTFDSLSFEFEAGTEAGRRRQPQLRSRGPVRGAARVRQQTEGFHPQQRFQRSAKPGGDTRRHHRQLFAVPAGGHDGRADAPEHQSRRGVQPAVRRECTGRTIQLRRTTQSVQPDGLTLRRRRFPRHSGFGRQRRRRRSATRVRCLRRTRHRRRVRLGLREGRLLLPLAGRGQQYRPGGFRRARRTPLRHWPHLGVADLPRGSRLSERKRAFAAYRPGDADGRRRRAVLLEIGVADGSEAIRRVSGRPEVRRLHPGRFHLADLLRGVRVGGRR